MKKILFLINTHFQLITAIQLSMTEYKNDIVDFVISDHSRNSDKIVNNLRKEKIGRNVFYVKSKKISFCKNNLVRLNNFIKVVNFEKLTKKLLPIDYAEYDIFLFHNLDLFTYAVFQKLVSANDKITVSRFEEGFSIYLFFNDKIKSSAICERYFRFIGKPSLLNRIKTVFLFHEEYLTYKMDYPIRKIPMISKDNEVFVRAVSNVFGYTEDVWVPEKYIIFEDCFWGDGYKIKDYELFAKIADMLPANSTAVKLHPRNRINRFENTNCHCMKNSSIPWEIIQMNKDYTDKVFLTVASGSVLASMLYFGEKIPTIFLYNVIEGEFEIKRNYTKYLEKVKYASQNSNIYIPETLEELKKIMEDLNQ